MRDACDIRKSQISHRFIRFSKWIVGSAKRYISFLQLDIPLAQRREDGDRSSQNKIVIRGPPPNRLSIRSPDSGCLAVRRIFLLSVHENERRLVYAVRRAHGFGRPQPPSGSAISTSGRLRRRSRKASYQCPEESSFASNRPDPMWSFRISVI